MRERLRPRTQRAGVVKTERICLKCREPFISEGDFICVPCNATNQRAVTPKRFEPEIRRVDKVPGSDS